jgi:hypothetical protein
MWTGRRLGRLWGVRERGDHGHVPCACGAGEFLPMFARLSRHTRPYRCHAFGVERLSLCLESPSDLSESRVLPTPSPALPPSLPPSCPAELRPRNRPMRRGSPAGRGSPAAWRTQVDKPCGRSTCASPLGFLLSSAAPPVDAVQRRDGVRARTIRWAESGCQVVVKVVQGSKGVRLCFRDLQTERWLDFAIMRSCDHSRQWACMACMRHAGHARACEPLGLSSPLASRRAGVRAGAGKPVGLHRRGEATRLAHDHQGVAGA